MAINDPFASAVEEAEQSDLLYGQIQVTAAFVMLAKGQPKRVWMDGQDATKDRSTEITMVLNPIAESGLTKLINRSFISDNRGEFGRIVWPSLRDGCGVADLRQLDNKFVKVELVKNGRKWQDKNGGGEREGTTFKFHTVYVDQAACVAAFEGDGNTPRAATNHNDAMAVDMSHGAGAPDNAIERQTAMLFLTTLAKQANGNKDVLAKQIAGMPLISKYFSMNSPEVATLMAA